MRGRIGGLSVISTGNWLAQNIEQLARIGPKRNAACPPQSVLSAAEHKAMEMKVRPIEGNLEDVMEVGDRAVARD
jgi:hypothetical protein